MKIGFIGAGNVTRTFGRHLINAGHTIVPIREVRTHWLSSLPISVRPPSLEQGSRQPSAML